MIATPNRPEPRIFRPQTPESDAPQARLLQERDLVVRRCRIEQPDLMLHAAFSFVFGAAISGMVYANLSAGIIKSVKRASASHASGLFVASLYLPAAFAGYLLGQLIESIGWTLAGIVQISGCALIAAALSRWVPIAKPSSQRLATSEQHP